MKRNTRAPHRLRPAVKWHGGKSYLASRIIPLLPPHREYVEPFAGGLSVLLNKPRVPVEIAGDLDADLMAFYRALRDRPDELIPRLEAIPYTEESFAWARGQIVDPDPIGRAARFLVKNRFSRGGLGRDFAWSDRLRGGLPGDLNAWRTIVGVLPAIARRLGRVDLYHGHALDLIARHDDVDTLLYLDPPYLARTRTAREVYAHEMGDEDHLALLEAIVHARAMVAISGYDNPLYARALKGWERHEFEMPDHSGQNKVKRRRIEVLWLSPLCDRFALG
jgi:DNA adenine methylase